LILGASCFKSFIVLISFQKTAIVAFNNSGGQRSLHVALGNDFVALQMHGFLSPIRGSTRH